MNQGIIHLLRIGAASFCAHKLLINVSGNPLKKGELLWEAHKHVTLTGRPHTREVALQRTRLRGRVRLRSDRLVDKSKLRHK
jgi:hypothetical protein